MSKIIKISALNLSLVTVLLVLVWGCGPVITETFRYEIKTMEPAKNLQDLGFIVIENVKLKELPPALLVDVPQLSAEGKVLVDDKGKMKMQKASLFPAGTLFYSINITNKTDHVVRLTTAVIRLFDPASNDYTPLSYDDLYSLWNTNYMSWASYDYQGFSGLTNRLKTLKIIDQRTELLPNLPYKGYIAFQPADLRLTGTYKLTFYDIPVEVDAAGKVTKTVRAEFFSQLEKWKYLYEAKNAFSKPELKSKEKVE